MSQTYVYPFDPTGSLTSNVIPNERHVLSGVTDREFNFIVPKFAPFFRNNLRIRHLALGRDLVEGVDYHLTHWFHAASHGVGRPVYGSITFLDRNLTGVVELRYQTIGGDWVYDEGTVLELMANRLMNPRITTWEQVVDLPFQFPVIDHEWDLDDLTGATEIVQKLDEITAAINAANDANGQSHVGDTNNPHNVTKVQVGLGLVENLPLANIAEAVAGASNEVYVTPVRVRNFVEAYVTPLMEAHTLRNDNPHGVTKTQVGLGYVQNYGIATSVQAIAGTSNTLYLTPVALKAVLDTNIIPLLSGHADRTNNPHNVTKVQVGLGNVENLPLASESEAIAGSRNDRYMTPLTTYQMVSEYVGEGMNNHIMDVQNPHRVTKTQVGLGSVQNYGVATVEQTTLGTADNLYVTPVGVRTAIEEVALASYRTHTNDGNNPHGTTKAQVGLGNVDNFPTATTEEAINGQASNRFMTPATTAAMLATIVGDEVSSHAGRRDNPHEVTAEQIGAITDEQLQSVLSNYLAANGTAVNASALGGRTYQELVSMMSGGTADNTLRFNGMTYDEVLEAYTTEIAPLATALEGKTVDEIKAEAVLEVPAPSNFVLPSFDSLDPTDRGWTRLFQTEAGQFEALLTVSNPITSVSSTALISFVINDINPELQQFTQLLIRGDVIQDKLWLVQVGTGIELWLEHAAAARGRVHLVVLSTETTGELTGVGETLDQEPVWSLLDDNWTVENKLALTSSRVVIDDVMLEARLDAFAAEMRNEAIESIAN